MACLSVLLGIYTASKLINRKVPEESVIMAIILPIALFNATEPLYVIPLGYFIARTTNKILKVGNKT